MQIAMRPRLQAERRSQFGYEPFAARTDLPARGVRRDRLHARLDQATRRNVTLITGPPGSGKTTLVAGWVTSSGVKEVLWLPSPSVGAPLAKVIADARRDLTSLGNSSPVLVVIDDVQQISDRQVATELENVIGHLGAPFKIILIGRHRGSISLAHLSLQTQVSEVTGRELDFTTEETDALVRAFGVRLDPEALDTLVRETHGWAAGLRLAAVLMSDVGNPNVVPARLNDVGGSFWEYMEAEVLPQLGREDVVALARASVAHPLDASLCEALSGRPDAVYLLESLVARNLFVTKEADNGRYELHPVFARYLSHRLEMEGHDVQGSAHRNTAEWMRQHGEFELAVHHYVMANRPDKAVELGAVQLARALVDVSYPAQPGLLPGDVPDPYFADDPARMYLLCTSLIHASRLEEAGQCLARMEIGLDRSPASALYRARVQWLGAMYDSANLDAEGVLAHFERAKEALDSAACIPIPASSPSWLVTLDNAVLSVLPWIVARAHAEAGRAEAAKQMLDKHSNSPGVPPGAFGLGPSTSVALACGRLREATALARRGIDIAGGRQDYSALAIESHVALADVLLEQDELGAARLELGKAREAAAKSGFAQWMRVVDSELARLSLAEGQLHRALYQLHAVRHANTNSGSLDARLDTLEVDCRLALRDLEGAQHVLDRIGPEPGQGVNLARLYLSAGRPDKAAAELSRASSRGSIRIQIRHALLQARIKLSFGDPTAAEHLLEQAVEAGRTEGFVRVFLEEPAQTLETLRRIYRNRDDHYVDHILSRWQSQTGSSPSLPLHITEPLTERERELIAFLPSHLTQAEMASRMYISANTVKTHMKGLYRKLSATSRSEAVEVAKACGLL